MKLETSGDRVARSFNSHTFRRLLPFSVLLDLFSNIALYEFACSHSRCLLNLCERSHVISSIRRSSLCLLNSTMRVFKEESEATSEKIWTGELDVVVEVAVEVRLADEVDTVRGCP